MKTAKLGALFLISIMALAGVGASSALWFENLTIDGTVNTGNVDVEWSLVGCGDNEEKDVSVITVDIVGNTMTVTVTNAYPCITYWVDFDIHCVGSIPVHFTPFVVTSPGMDLNWISITPEIGTTQLHTGESWYGTLEIHLDNTALESHTYTFTVTLMAHQYNENP